MTKNGVSKIFALCLLFGMTIYVEFYIGQAYEVRLCRVNQIKKSCTSLY